MAKYKVKDINKNGKIDGWEQAKYDAINKPAEKDSPLDFLGGNIAASISTARRASDIVSQARDAQASNTGVTNTAQTPNATGTIGGALAGATTNAGMLSGLNTQSNGDIESRVTALEQNVQPMTNVPPAPSSIVSPFSPRTQAVAQGIFGTTPMMQKAVNAPAMFKDQTGDGKITRADVIKARIEGYKK